MSTSPSQKCPPAIASAASRPVPQAVSVTKCAETPVAASLPARRSRNGSIRARAQPSSTRFLRGFLPGLDAKSRRAEITIARLVTEAVDRRMLTGGESRESRSESPHVPYRDTPDRREGRALLSRRPFRTGRKPLCLGLPDHHRQPV